MYEKQLHPDGRTGRPCLDWDNKKWTCYFTALKKTVSSSGIRPRRFPCPSIRPKSNEDYQGKTAYQSYCTFLNSVLTTIRRGESDYCYFIYQIADLLQLEPDLQTRLCCEDRLSPYFEVWLNHLDKEDLL